jgi:hypothetical protein
MLCTVLSHVRTSCTLNSQSEILLHWKPDIHISKLSQGRCVDEPLVSQQWRGSTLGVLTSQTLAVLYAFTSQEIRMSLFDEWHCCGSIISSGPAAKEVSQPLEERANTRPQLLSPGRLTFKNRASYI